MELHYLEGRARSNELDRMVDNAKRASDFLKALAHESRLMILCILAEGEKSVSRQYRNSSHASEPMDWFPRDAMARRSITDWQAMKRAPSSA
jgi:DNA-binding transcriptional ArsR family regulator